MNQYKKCGGKCHKILPLESFYLCRSGRDGRDSRCKDCAKANQKVVRARGIKNDKDYNTPARRCHLKKYGLTLEEYQEKLEKQNHCCAICKEPEVIRQGGVLSNLCIDHDHVTNAVRELLCRRCNALIGHAKDSIEILQVAIEYLRRHNGGDSGNAGNRERAD
jgi:hypothetical protein